jgi:hypothetical protein
MTMLALLFFFLMFLLILRHLYTPKYLAILIVIELTKWIKNTHIYENLFDSGLIVLVWNLVRKYQPKFKIFVSLMKKSIIIINENFLIFKIIIIK